MPLAMKWIVDNHVHTRLVAAQAFVDKTIQDSDVQVFHYKGYGSDFIKKVGKMSPDAYMQLCLQVTFYRIHGYCSAVYETSSTRQYLHGRTETCRSLTMDAKNFILAFENPTLDSKTKYALMSKAAGAHIQYIRTSSQGFGVDRHLLGLRLCMKSGEKADIFTHPLFAKSSKWQLSTSALFAGERMLGTGFGTVVSRFYLVSGWLRYELHDCF